jgi:diguanylate cyclase (GGDEF)-like protein/PAS domain S-box-containing protein
MATLGVGDSAGGESDAAALAARWARTIAGTSYVPLELPEIEAFLVAHARRLIDVWRREPFDPEPARPVGAALVDGHFTHPDTISRTLALLTETLSSSDAAATSRVGAILGALAAGYATRLQERTLSEQEAIRVAALTARGEAEQAARVSEARFQAVFAGAAIGMGVGDTEGTILDANPALTTMLGYTAEEMRQRNVGEFMHPDDTGEVWELYGQLIRGERESFRTAKQFLRSDGRGVWTHLTVSLIRNDTGTPEFQIAVIEDVTDLRRLQNQLQFQAHHDTLTGLANRALFQLRLDHLIAKPTPGNRLGVCLLDLDGFKAINDSVGHAVGDQVLVEIAGRLESALSPKGHLVARLGGDEFVILVEGTTGAQDVIRIAEQALAAIARPVLIGGHPYSVTASAGLVERATAEADAADLVRAADITLYWAKADGKDRWALFDSKRSDLEVAQYTLARMLPAALAGNQFRLHYQPLFSLASGAPTGVEALLRWQHPWLGQIMPDRFIGPAEEIGIIVPIGGWVLQTACSQARNWARRFTDPLRISVNIAMRQLTDPRLIERITRVLEANGLAPAQLQLELTERAVVGSDSEPLTALAALADLGVRIAIDDFGTGYSNMTYLRRLPVSELKLDASFIDELGSAGRGRDTAAQIVRSIVSLAHNLGLTVTAEGVETAEQADALREIGCDTAQGTYFGPPGPPDAIEQLFAEHLARTAGA